MQNFNTNQTRHFYVAAAVDSNVDTNLDIALKQTATGELYFAYKNADGLLTRSDTFDPKKIISLKKTNAADMNVPIIGHKITADTDAISIGSGLVGKVLNCTVNVHQAFDFDDSNMISYVATIIGDSTNTASSTAFHKALAVALAKALPEKLVKVYCGATEVTKTTAVSGIANSPTAVYLIPKVQKYVRGKLSAETATLSVSFRMHGDDIVWGKDEAKTVAAINTADSLSLTPANIASVYNIADLEYFALGERGEIYRNTIYPYNYDVTYAIDLAKTYDMVSIEYYWNGDAENVQKSPRMIQIACDASGSNVASGIYDAVAAAMAGASS